MEFLCLSEIGIPLNLNKNSNNNHRFSSYHRKIFHCFLVVTFYFKDKIIIHHITTTKDKHLLKYKNSKFEAHCNFNSFLENQKKRCPDKRPEYVDEIN